MNPLSILQDQFGHSSFRLHQEAVIASVLKKKDTFVLMPTGGGKSICYQVPALMLEGLTLVISPLIALMKDQVDALRGNGIEAAYLNSTQSQLEHDSIIENARLNKLKLLYLAPERMLSNERGAAFMESLRSFGISLIAIDEAHCISHWGHDFRPEYRMLSKLKILLPAVPVIALTATADRLTQKDIIEKLELEDPAVFVSSFNRVNIRYRVEQKKDSLERLLEFLQPRRGESGIIYCLSRRSTEALAEDLSQQGFRALPYHAGLNRETRASHQEMFRKDVVKIIVATIAFGMGIDKPNVRFVVHMDLPKNIESYYQETGRAGRDGLESEVLLFYSPADVIKLKKFAQIENNPSQSGILLKKLNEMARYAEGSTCRRQQLLNYFNEEAPSFCGNCDACLDRDRLHDETARGRKAMSAIHGPPKEPGKENEPEVPCEQHLLARLTELRTRLSANEHVSPKTILPDRSLVELASYLPPTLNDLSRISGFGQMKIERYGNQFRSAVVAYCNEHNLKTRIHLKPPKRPRPEKPERDNDTKKLTLQLFNEGYPAQTIAVMRDLSPSTIEGHLAFYIQEGKIPVDRVVASEKISAIQRAIASANTRALAKVKTSLGETCSYGEIRCVLAHSEWSGVKEPRLAYRARRKQINVPALEHYRRLRKGRRAGMPILSDACS